LSRAYIRSAYYNRGLCYKLTGKPDRALADFAKAFELDPDNPSALNQRGTIFENQGKLQKALAEFERSLELNSGQKYIRKARTRVMARIEAKRLEPKPERPADPKLASRAVNGLGLDLYGIISQESDDNLFFSPYSISAALAMAQAGASGQTAGQMDKVLHFEQEGQKMQVAYGVLDTEINDSGNVRDQELIISNAVWLQKGLKAQKAYSQVVRKQFSAALKQADFKDAFKASGRINGWVSQNTRGMIPQLVSPDTLQDARMVLTNAVYFLGRWSRPFGPKNTSTKPFWLTAQKIRTVNMMYKWSDFAYYEDESLQAVRIYYLGGSLNMLVLLPRDKEGLKDLEARLKTTLPKVRQGFKLEDVKLHLPRFSSDSSITLNDALIKLGMSRAFSSRAEFDQMAKDERLAISAVIHKAKVKVQEKGTEAAASTGAVAVPTGIAPPGPPPVPKVFRADHPFIFLIEDNKTGCILFMGRLTKPDKE
jgi:serpin B